MDATAWQATLERLVKSTKKVGVYFGGSNRLTEVAVHQSCRSVKNLIGRDTTLTTLNAG